MKSLQYFITPKQVLFVATRSLFIDCCKSNKL